MNHILLFGGGVECQLRITAARTFDAAMDWTHHGVQSLVLFFGGSPASTGGQLYLKINDTKVAYHGASSDLMHLGWNKWTIPLSSVIEWIVQRACSSKEQALFFSVSMP